MISQDIVSKCHCRLVNYDSFCGDPGKASGNIHPMERQVYEHCYRGKAIEVQSSLSEEA